jgi:hypothetical protein
MKQVTISSLTPQRCQLVEMIQDIHFGHITHITVRNGEPEFTSETIIERDIKLNKQITPPEDTTEDYILKKEFHILLKQITKLGNGTIRKLEIMHGLPFLMRIWERAA